MKPFVKLVTVFLLVTCSSGCNYFTFTPRSKKMVQREKPSIVLLDRIIEFREENNAWPFSKEEFTSKGQKYKEAFEGFPYLKTVFKVIDNNTMTFSFYEHIKDVQNYQQTEKIDLNSYNGQVRFNKENDKFIWKIKMN
jgi:hypothetical protein